MTNVVGTATVVNRGAEKVSMRSDVVSKRVLFDGVRTVSSVVVVESAVAMLREALVNEALRLVLVVVPAGAGIGVVAVPRAAFGTGAPRMGILDDVELADMLLSRKLDVGVLFMDGPWIVLDVVLAPIGLTAFNAAMVVVATDVVLTDCATT